MPRKALPLSLSLPLLAAGLPATAFAEPLPEMSPVYADGHDHDHDHATEPEPDVPEYFTAPVDYSAAIDCNESQNTGYVQGDAFAITVVTVDGKPVEVETANAYYQMQQAAAADGVGIKVVSGFRTMSEQEYLYGCYINCNCNNCNLAAKPGYSNHQSGHALDLNTAATGVLNWLNAHGEYYGFARTVPSEPWHWEWWGGGPPANGPCGEPDYRAEYVEQSFPLASAPPVVLNVGECINAWIDLRNTGTATWNGETRLSPTPRDQASPLHDAAGWLSPTRIAAPETETPPGDIGHFAFRLCGTAAGDYYQTFGLVQEGVTWFSDAPLGGGPPDEQLEVHVMVIDPPPPPPAPPDPSSGSDGGDEGGEAGSGEGGSGEGGEPDPTSGGVGDEGGGSSGGSSAGPDSGGESAGAAEDAGCGCRSEGGGPGLPGLLALGWLAARRRRR